MVEVIWLAKLWRGVGTIGYEEKKVVDDVWWQWLARRGRGYVPWKLEARTDGVLVEEKVVFVVGTNETLLLLDGFTNNDVVVSWLQPTISNAQVDVKFVFCNLTKEDQKALVALEIMQDGDIIILDCKENLNKGKTSTYFSSLPQILNDTDRPYHYVICTLVMLFCALAWTLSCIILLAWDNMISWDIVEWIRDSEIPKNHMEGPEDKMFGDLIREGHRARNR
ncbi:beta-1,3-galactosyltransferase [Salix suchowensis]|nr:beta-1,3-galactosyltransferase [Salix suchowensis]